MNQQIFTQVDRTAIKVSQAITMLLLLTAFFLDSWPLAAFVAVANLLGAVLPPLSVFGQVYYLVLKPSGLIKPRLVSDQHGPHRFAQAVGGGCVAISALLLVSGQITLGWLFSWLVIVLAGLNVFISFCAGCFMYRQLSRLGVPGFECSHCLNEN